MSVEAAVIRTAVLLALAVLFALVSVWLAFRWLGNKEGSK